MGDEPIRDDVDELQTLQPKHSVVMRFDRERGLQSLVASISVTCAESTHSARSEMIELLRALALDIETGVA